MYVRIYYFRLGTISLYVRTIHCLLMTILVRSSAFPLDWFYVRTEVSYGVKLLFEKIRSHMKFLFWYSYYYFLTPINNLSFVRKQLCSCIPILYTQYVSQLGNYLTIIFSFHIYNTQPRIFILQGYFITLLYFNFRIRLWTFDLFRLVTRFFKRRIAHFHYIMLQSFNLSFVRKQFFSCIPR